MSIDQELSTKIRDQVYSEWSPDPYVRGTIVYGSLILRSLIVLCGGGLFLFPAIMSASQILAKDFITTAMPCFAVGLLLGALSSFFAHLNMRELADYFRSIAHREHRWQIRTEEERAHPEYLKWDAELGEVVDASGKKIDRYLNLSVGLGFAGYAAFFVGCFWGAVIVLDQSNKMESVVFKEKTAISHPVKPKKPSEVQE